MSSEFIANVDYTLEATPDGGWSPGSPLETRLPAAFADAPDGKDILTQQIIYAYPTVPLPPSGAPCVFSPNTFVSGAGSIVATAQKVKCNDVPVMREGDTGNCVGSFMPPLPATVPIPCSCSLKIKTAGQTKVKAV